VQVSSTWNARITLAAIFLVQIAAHLAWLPISAHSGQVAIPWMMNHGRVLFGNLLEQHAPATSVIAALALRLLPFDPLTVDKLLNLLLVCTVTLLVYELARRLAQGSTIAGLSAALVWLWWEPVYGNVLFYFDSLLGLCVCCALACFVFLKGNRAAFFAGLLMGAATLAKQHAWAAVVVFAFYMVAVHKRGQIRFFIGLLLLPLLTLVVVAAQGNLERYLYWNWAFNVSGLMDAEFPTGDFVRKFVLSNVLVPAFVLLSIRQSKRGLYLWISALWLATTLTLLPRFSVVHAMAQLPLSAVISGVVVSTLVTDLRSVVQKLREGDTVRLVLFGMVVAVAFAWLWTGIVVYAPGPLGRAGVPAHDEFDVVALRLREVAQPGDTLFVLPETDSTPQLHPMSGLLPPGTWVKGWRWYFGAPGITEQLISEWETEPPGLVVVFPDLLQVGQPGIQSFVDFVDRHYTEFDSVEDVVFHGDAVIYRLNQPLPQG
jgi:hypothetical protein